MADKVTPIEVQKHLKGIDYPASKEDIIDYAEQQGAGEEIISLLEKIPDEEYETPAELSKALGELT